MQDYQFWIEAVKDIVFLGVGFLWLNYKFGKKLKDHEPFTAEQILRKENYLNSKRDVFLNQ